MSATTVTRCCARPTSMPWPKRVSASIASMPPDHGAPRPVGAVSPDEMPVATGSISRTRDSCLSRSSRWPRPCESWATSPATSGSGISGHSVEVRGQLFPSPGILASVAPWLRYMLHHPSQCADLGSVRGSLTGEFFGTRYWLGPDRFIASGLEGDDSRIIMDHALAFVHEAIQRSQPFLAVIWFHAPHNPVVAGAQYRALYPDQGPDEQHYFGVLTAMDEQIGRLRRALQDLGVAASTMLWFCSDNGPARGHGNLPEELRSRAKGSSGGLRSKKASLYEGGIRVPGLLVWPAGVPEPKRIEAPCVTSDCYPTILAALGHRPRRQPRPLDGIDILGLLRAESARRPKPIYFRSGEQLAVVSNHLKLFSRNRGKRFELYDSTKIQTRRTTWPRAILARSSAGLPASTAGCRAWRRATGSRLQSPALKAAGPISSPAASSTRQV